MRDLKRSTEEIISPTHSYDKLVFPVEIIRISYAFNDSYILENLSGILQDIPNRSHLYRCEGAASVRIYKG